MKRLVLLLEEESMQVLLDGLLPRLFPGLLFQCVPHEGKADLERSIPRKLGVSLLATFGGCSRVTRSSAAGSVWAGCAA